MHSARAHLSRWILPEAWSGFEITQAASGASITNSGKIESQGGIVSLSAQEAQAVRTNVVSVGGVVKATRLERRGGVVYLSGGTQGIAEVSGDVSASKKVQTTGEYVVVKEGAVVKAPKILVGGDFQGKGDVQTAQRTLVERGALLDAGAGGRVIVWSDDVTWFNGNISAPGGFAEVSGKETLASVNLAGIDVGELLLDPVSITIAATGTTTLTASPNGDIAAADSGGDLILGAADIGAYAGDLSLAATGAITVNVAITKTTGNLTLDAGGVLTIAANITTSAGNLTLQATTINLTADVELISSGNTSLTGAISGNQDLTLRTNGNLILNSNINIGTTGTLAFAALVVRLGSDIELTGGTVTLLVTDMVDGSAINADLTINASVNLTLGSVNLGTGNLVVNNTSTNATTLGVPSTWTAGDITLTGAIAHASDNLAIRASGVLTLNDNIDVGTGDLTLDADGGIVLGADITLNAEDISLSGAINGTNGNHSFTAIATNFLTFLDVTINTGEGDITLRAATIPGNVVSGNPAIVLTGENVDLAVPQVEGNNSSGGAIIAGGRNLEINANENIRLGMGNEPGTSLSLGSGGLILRADMDNDGTGAIINGGGTRFIMAGDVFLQQAGAFAETSLFRNNSTVTGNVSLRLTTAVGQDIHPWMAAFGTGFSLHGVTGVVLNRIDLTASDIPAGFTRNGAIDLRASDILLGVPLTGTSVALRASSILGLNNQPVVIHATRGEITATKITATGEPNTGIPTVRDTPSSTLTQSAVFGSAAPFIFAPFTALGTAQTLTLETAAAAAQTVQGWMVVDGRDLSLTSTGGDIMIGGDIDVGTGSLTLIASGNIVANTSPRPVLTADTVNLELTGTNLFTSRLFDETSPITTLTITTAAPPTAPQEYRGWMAGTNRNLTITSSAIVINSTAINLGTGDLTLNSEFGILLTEATGLTINAGDVTFFTGSGALLEMQGIDVSQFVVEVTGNIVISQIDLGMTRVELRADNGTISGSGGFAVRIDADVLLMRQMTAFADGLLNVASIVTGAVTLRVTGAGVDQTIHPWMTALGGTDFSLGGAGMALNSITLPAAADFGTTAVDLRATTITLEGALTVATSVALRADTIAGDDDGVVVIEITTGTLTTTDINDMGAAGTEAPATADSVTSFSLTQSAVFGSAAPFTFGTGLTVILETAAAAAAAQPVQGWMVAAGSSLSLTSTGGDITIGRNINLGTGSLTLIANGNIMSVGTPRVVTADTVTLELTVATVFDGFDVIMTGSSFGATAPFATNSDIGTLNIITQADQTYRGWMARTGRNLTITATGGILIGSTAINLGSTGNLTLNASLGVRLTNRAGLTITAGDFTLFAGGLSLSFPAEINVVSQFVVNASGDITTTTITLPGARVELRADNGSIMTTLSPDGGALASILADFVLLRQSVAFPDGLLSRNGNQIARLELRTTTAVDQPIYRWMRAAVVNSPGGNIVRSFSLRGEGDVVLTSITLRAAGFGAGDFGIASVDLQATTINLDAAITLTGAAISLTGAITVASSSNNDLTITASGVLTLNSGINLGSGILTINADDRINVPNMNTDITASAINIIFTDPAVDSPAAGFTTAAGVATLDNADFIPDPDYTINLGCTIAMCELGDGSALTLSPLLEADTSITLNAGANALAFNGTGAITITSPTIMITAGSIDIGSRSLTITAADGTITLSMLTSITGTGAASLSLDAATIAFTTAPTLNVPSISVAQKRGISPIGAVHIWHGDHLADADDRGGADGAGLDDYQRPLFECHDRRCADPQYWHRFRQHVRSHFEWRGRHCFGLCHLHHRQRHHFEQRGQYHFQQKSHPHRRPRHHFGRRD